jgi:hypothetical protein
VGTVFAVKAKSQDHESRADDHCDAATGCDTTGLPLNQAALGSARVATAFFVGGGALIAGGIVLYVVGAPKPDVSSVAVSPVLAESGIGVAAHGRF